MVLRLRIGARGNLTIPKSVCNACNLEAGDLVEVRFEEGHLEVRLLEKAPSAASFHRRAGRQSRSVADRRGEAHDRDMRMEEDGDVFEPDVRYCRTGAPSMAPSAPLSSIEDRPPRAPKRELESSTPMSEWTSPEDEEAWSDL